MDVVIRDKTPAELVHGAIVDGLKKSRFTTGGYGSSLHEGTGTTIASRTRIRIVDIRLRAGNEKRYCGHHPNACELVPTGRATSLFLEGADWVGVNDLLNDVADELDLSANIYTSIVKVRQGRLRRINYGSQLRENAWTEEWQWVKYGDDSDWADYCGKMTAPDSTYPFGTPGTYSRELRG